MKSGKHGPWQIYSEVVNSDTEPIQFMPFPLSLPLSPSSPPPPSSSSWSICVAGCLWRNEGLQSAITNVCCPVSRHHGGFQLNFDFTCQNMSTCMRVVCCKSSCFTESLHPQKFGCGALCRCCIIGYISFEYGHNTGVYLGICYKCMHHLEDHELRHQNFQWDGAMSEQENSRRYWYGYICQGIFLKCLNKTMVEDWQDSLSHVENLEQE